MKEKEDPLAFLLRLNLELADKEAQGEKITPPGLNSCPQCHSPKLPHHVCKTCGSYDGREVLAIKAPKPKKAS